jgi:hypothetical protein
MLRPYIGYCCPGLILLSLIFWAFAGYAYRVNAKRAAEDPDKKDFHPMAVHLVPFTWPALILIYLFIFVTRALLYGIYLILFAFALIAFRKPFLLIWLDKVVRKVGDKLLEANTFLIRIVFGDWGNNSQPA